MEEAWERAVEAAKGKEEAATTRSLTLDGSLKCIQGRLPPPPSLLEAFLQLQKLSIANVGLTSLVDFPRLPRLEVLNLSDNRIAGGLEHLVEAGLGALRELDLSNNKIQLLQDLAPLSKLGLVSLDLYQCPVTSISDYRVQVFRLIKNLQYLDKMDLENEEKPESDEEDEVSEDDASGDADADADADGDGVDVEEDVVEGDSKGFRVSVDGEDDESEEDEGEENEELYEEDEDEEGSFQEVFAVSDQDGSGHAVEDIGSDEEDVEDDDEDDDDDDDEDEDVGEEDDEEADGVDSDKENDEGDEDVEEEDEEDEEDDDEVEEDYGTEYLIQVPEGQPEDDEGASDFEPGENEEENDDDLEDKDEDEDEDQKAAPAFKRKWDGDDELEKNQRPRKH
ncbi:hypothetical protein O6H91_06G137900 [Diphasiastrum complanatum]|uniref:Uncharacterized protein n=1 Tax=Diphasiastrum complanatum TaxID=34168 RepID=A0ACC2DJQ8_DIPCM|nr:hypothetical protein O6H91_06G137900 [Diphasiastrum complanatum]